MQNKLLKLLMRIPFRTPTNILHWNAKILKVKDIYKTNLLSFVNTCLIGDCPDYFKYYFSVQNQVYDLRSQGSLVVQRTNRAETSKGCFVHGASLWNKIHISLQDKKRTKSLKNALIKYKLDQYS